MERVEIPEQQVGDFRIEHFVTDAPDFASMLRGRPVPVGQKFTRLVRGRTLVMSDTPAEMRDHQIAAHMAKGSVLINGLGIGMLLRAVLAKPQVTDVTVVEISVEVLAMVSPHYADPRITFVHADCFKYVPPKGKRYDMVWHDIWDHITSDNLPQMHKLHRKYGRRADWQGSWCRSECERADKQWKRSGY